MNKNSRKYTTGCCLNGCFYFQQFYPINLHLLIDFNENFSFHF